MGDEMDRVQAVNEWWQEECLAEHRRNAVTRDSGKAVTSHQSPVTVCIDCGDEIPEARRRAAPGCRRCIDCQTLFERRHR